MEIAAQVIGLIGAAALILSFLPKSKKNIILLQLMGSFLFAVQYLLLGILSDCLYVGFLLNFIGIFRCLVYSNRDKLRADSHLWFICFVATYILFYVLNFTVFGLDATATNLIVELLPVLGTTALTYGYKTNSSKFIRYSGLINSPLWLIYNIVRNSIGGIICEVLCIISALVGIYRHERKKKT